MDKADYAIKLQGVSKSYKLGKERLLALDGIDLAIARRQFVGVMGPSGSGKTTLAQIAGGLMQPTRGEVVVRGSKLNTLSDKELAAYRNRHIGFVFQNFSLLNDYTVLENVSLPKIIAGESKRERERTARQYLGVVGIINKAANMARDLSGGERQRVAIARALIMRPAIIIADEPTGNLDSKHGKGVVTVLRQLTHTHDITVLMVTHDMQFMRYMDRVVYIRDGKVVAS